MNMISFTFVLLHSFINHIIAEYDYSRDGSNNYRKKENFNEIISQNIHIEKSVGAKSLKICTNETTIYVNSTFTSIPNNKYKDCAGLSQVIFEPSSRLTTIGDYSFYNTSLRTFEIPSTVTHVGAYAFAYCQNLINISFSTKH